MTGGWRPMRAADLSAVQIGADRLIRPPSREIDRCALRPILFLPPNPFKLDIADAFGDSSEGCAGLDWLELHGVSDEDRFRASLLNVPDHIGELL